MDNVERESRPPPPPRRPRKSSMIAVTLGVLVGLGGTAISTLGVEQYGCVLFVLLPIVIGAVVVLAAKPGAPASEFRFGTIAGLTVGTIFLLGAILFCTALEGFACLVMATPLWAPLAILGGYVGRSLRFPSDPGVNHLVIWGLIATIPLGLGAEYIADPEPAVFQVQTAIDINAPPEVVWNNVVAFPALAEPTEWLFKCGIAYPESASIVGHGAGATRFCTFSTGSFVEPIEVWDEPRLLRFRVTANPAPMTEWSAFQEVHPPHLEGFMVSKRGQFELLPLEGGGTRLVGTTWYQHGLGPEWYWRLWSDWIIHSIHRRVLNHIGRLAEQEKSAGAPVAHE